MRNLKRSDEEQYTEAEAAAILGISLPELHAILDKHVFDQGPPRPAGIQFNGSDLLLLNYWCNGPAKVPIQSKKGQILEMPQKKK